MLTNLDLKITKNEMDAYREMLGEEHDWIDKEKQIEEYQDKIDKFVKNREEIEEELREHSKKERVVGSKYFELGKEFVKVFIPYIIVTLIIGSLGLMSDGTGAREIIRSISYTTSIVSFTNLGMVLLRDKENKVILNIRQVLVYIVGIPISLIAYFVLGGVEIVDGGMATAVIISLTVITILFYIDYVVIASYKSKLGKEREEIIDKYRKSNDKLLYHMHLNDRIKRYEELNE